MSERELQRQRAIARVFPHGPPEIPPALPDSGSSFTRMPRDVHERLRQLVRAHALWTEIESWVGKHGGSGDVSQVAMIRALGWAPSTFWHARQQLIALGMLIVEMPERGNAYGPKALRRLTLVHYLPRKAREVAAKSAKRIHKAAAAVIGGEMHPAALATLARELAKAGAPPPAANGPPG